MHSSGLKLPLLGLSGGDGAVPGPRRPLALDGEAAQALGLVARQPARAQGLLDRFGRAHRTLRISVTERCNLRCRYCMPEEGVPLHAREELLSFEEIERLATLFVSLGVRRIRLTGGEPLVRKELPALARRLGALKSRGLAELLLTTNGLLLEPLLPELRAAGLDGVNLSLDTLSPETFARITRRAGLDETLAALRAAAATPGLKVKVNAVAMRGVNDGEITALAAFIAGELGVELRYIEYMPFDGNHWSEDTLYPAHQIRAALHARFALEARGLDHGGAGTAQLYALRDRETLAPLRGRVGIISSMSEPFCGTCSRLRLTADGQLRWCLLDEGELDLRGPLRAGASDADLTAVIEEALNRKAAGHAPASSLLAQQATGSARSMIRIGG